MSRVKDVRNDVDNLAESLDMIGSRVRRLERFASAVIAFLEDREDIDDNGNANEAMQLLIELQELGVSKSWSTERSPDGGKAP